MTRKPWDPTPMNAILTLSLGGTYPAPPNTRRGTIARPIAAAAVCPKNLRREIEPSKRLGDRSLFLIVPAIVTRSQLRSFPHASLMVPMGLEGQRRKASRDNPGVILRDRVRAAFSLIRECSVRKMK